MRILTIGGGPGGLYSGILLKKAFPEVEVRILERNQADDTFGWGVVFSDETLSGFEEADAESFREIRSNFAYWSDIETFCACVRAVGASRDDSVGAWYGKLLDDPAACGPDLLAAIAAR